MGGGAVKRRILTILGAALAGLIAAALGLTKPWTWQPLDLDKITSPAQVTVILDRNGESAADAGGENRVLLGADEMPLLVKQAFVAVEDARF